MLRDQVAHDLDAAAQVDERVFQAFGRSIEMLQMMVRLVLTQLQQPDRVDANGGGS